MSFFDFLRARCPSCKKRGLKSVQFIRATVVIDGRRAPAAWDYLRCPTCDGRFRSNVWEGGTIKVADDDDWLRHVVNAPGPMD